MDWDPLLTVNELREVIALHHALLTVTPSDTDRIDLHQTLSDLYRRLAHVQGRHLAVAAGMAGAWQTAGATSCCPATSSTAWSATSADSSTAPPTPG